MNASTVLASGAVACNPYIALKQLDLVLPALAGRTREREPFTNDAVWRSSAVVTTT